MHVAEFVVRAVGGVIDVGVVNVGGSRYTGAGARSVRAGVGDGRDGVESLLCTRCCVLLSAGRRELCRFPGRCSCSGCRGPV